MSSIKEFSEALEPIGDRIKQVDARVSDYVQKTEEWMRAAEEKFLRSRSGSLVVDNLKAAIPERFHPGLETYARTGSKDPVRKVAMETWLKNHLKSQMPVHSRFAGQLADENARLAAAMGEEKAYLNENTTGQGGYSVPTIVESDLYRVIEDNSVVRNLAQKIVMQSKTSNLVNLASNVTTYIVTELGAAITQGEPTINKVDLTAKDFVAYGQATLDVLQDEVVGLLNFFLVNAGEQIGEKEDQLALEGTSGDAFTGLAGQTTTASAALGYIWWQQMTTATNAPATPTLAQLASACYGPLHKSTRRDGCAWFFHPVAWAKFFSQTSTAVPTVSANYWVPTPGAPAADGQLLGYPVYCHAGLTDVTAGSNVFFGSFGRGMVFGDRAGIDLMVSEHEKFQYGLVSMRVIKRTGIAVPLPAAFAWTAKVKAAV